MKVERIAECSTWSVLQYFWPALSDNLPWKPIFGLFESGHFTQVYKKLANLSKKICTLYFGPLYVSKGCRL